ncbi:MAG: VOC family protein [Chitinophagaceae bacterium]|nr:VOC family protein [Chitinophagaceae bacterium]
MTKELWINLPVKDVKKSREFFTKIGFIQNTHFPETEQMSSVFAGTKSIVIMLCAEPVFQGFSQNKIADTKQSTEVLFSFDAESRDEVDELAEKVTAAGGNVFAKPGENQGWMYGCAFTDPDGHRWNVLHMDMSKMPKG